MQELILNAEVRKNEVANEAKNLRKGGLIPGIYYQRGFDNIPISIDELQLNLLVKSVVARVINLSLPNNVQYKSILKDVQFDPITDRPIHFDLIGIREDEKIILNIPVVLEGISIGQRDGGLVQHLLHKIEVECLPKDIPESIVVKIELMNIGDSVHIKDLSIPNVDIRVNPETTIMSIIPPTVEAVVAPTEAEAAATAAATAAETTEGAAEPEVVKTKGKKEEESK
jgi:large subunit ribosomal protein L25